MCTYSWRVPFCVWGKLAIVPSGDLGKWGDKEGEPVAFSWKASWHLASLAVWGILVLVLMLPDNRTTKAWQILLLVFAIVGVWTLIGSRIAARPTTLAILHQTCIGLTVVIATTCVSAPALGRIKGWMRIGCFLLATVVACAVPLMRTGLSGDAVVAVLYLSLCVVPVGPAVLFARWRMGNCFHRMQFLFWLAVGLGLATATVGLFISVLLVGTGAVDMGALSVFNAVSPPTVVIAASLFMLLLPFIIWMSSGPFWQHRLNSLLSIAAPTSPSKRVPRILKKRRHNRVS